MDQEWSNTIQSQEDIYENKPKLINTLEDNDQDGIELINKRLCLMI
jgi:hypothetical protein